MQLLEKRVLILVIEIASICYGYAVEDKVLQEYSKTIESKLNRSVAICDDFYEFACGSYHPEIPAEKSSITEFNKIDDLLVEQLNKILKSPISENETDPIRNVKTYYSNCMNTETIEWVGLNPIKKLLKDLGGWPVIAECEWKESSWRWQDVAMKMEIMGFSSHYLFDFSISPDLQNASKRVIYFDQPSLGLSKEYYDKGLCDELVVAYKNYQVDFAVIFGARPLDAVKQMYDVLLFEKSLANISLAKEDLRNFTKLYNPMKLRDLQLILPSFYLREYINQFLSYRDHVDNDEIVIVSNPKFFEKLHELLKTTSPRTIANYMMWRASSSVAPYLNEEVRKRRLEYLKVVSGISKYEPRWKECVGRVTSALQIASSALYVKNYFDKNSRSIASEMAQNIRKEFVSNLETVDWMDVETKKFVLKKIEKMKDYVGYPDELVDDEVLSDYYFNLKLAKDEYLFSNLKTNRFKVAKNVKKFRLPVNKTEWENQSNAVVVNAFFNHQRNSVTLTAGILQGSFFSADLPNYMNYGAIGNVIGHEITHGFDDKGRQFDFDGNLVNWWQEDTKKAFLEKAQCIINQYGNYTDPQTKLNLNGFISQGENIADNGGLLFAYRAYQKWAQKNGVEKSMPGLEFTNNQLFWLSAAQTRCAAYRTENLKYQITTGVHSIPRFRVIGPMSNIKEFSDDFNCPSDSPMNPKNKCKVW